MRLLLTAACAFAILVAVAAGASADDQTPVPAVTERVVVQATVQGKPVKWWARRAVQARKDANARGRTIRRMRRELRIRWSPTVDYAYRLAAATYRVSYWELRSIGGCESGHSPGAANGQYRGVMQEGPMFERGPYGSAGFSVWDPIANVLTAAHARVHDGSWRQWECQP